MGILKMEAHTEGGLFSWYSSLSPSPKNAPSAPGMTISRPLHLGQSFRFEKNGLHSVTANAKFKMSLLLVLE